MKLNTIWNTCSMLEIGEVNLDSLKVDKIQFIHKINRGLQALNKPPLQKKKYCLIYNCTGYTVAKQAKKLGFKKVFAYRGESYVSVYMLKTEDLFKKSWLERIDNFFDKL